MHNRFVALTSRSAAQLRHGAHPCQGLYWTQSEDARPRVAFLAVHYNVDFSEHYLGPLLANHDFGFLGWNTRFRAAEDQFELTAALDDVAAAMSWLRDEARLEVIVLLGNSGGGSLLAAYQATAHEGDLPPGDLFVSLNAHLGRPEVLTSWLDPSVVDERDPVPTDSSLDMYDPANGPPYAEEFVSRYRAAQQARNERITGWVRSELERLNAADIPDRIFPLYRAMADLRFTDPSLDPSDRPTPACLRGEPRAANRAITAVGRSSSLRTWLSMWSLETSRCKIELSAPEVRLPALVIQSMADVSVFPSDARRIHALLGGKDKELCFVPGAHYFDGDGGDAQREHVADLIARWVTARS